MKATDAANNTDATPGEFHLGHRHGRATYTVPTDSLGASVDGTYGFSTIAQDAAGNREAAPATVDARTTQTVQDSIAPSTTDNADNQWHNQAVTVTLTASDAGTGVAATHYKVNGGAQQTGTSVHISAINNDGTHTITYWSVDNAGNTEATNTATVKIDATAPSSVTFAANAPADGATYFPLTVPTGATCAAADALSGVARRRAGHRSGTTPRRSSSSRTGRRRRSQARATRRSSRWSTARASSRASSGSSGRWVGDAQWRRGSHEARRHCVRVGSRARPQIPRTRHGARARPSYGEPRSARGGGPGSSELEDRRMAVDVVEARREPQREVRRGAHESEWMHSMRTGGDEAAAFWAGARVAVAVSAMLWLGGAVAVLLLVRAL